MDSDLGMMSPMDARKLLEEDGKHRVDQVKKTIDSVLATYECELVAVPLFLPDGRVTTEIRIVVK